MGSRRRTDETVLPRLSRIATKVRHIFSKTRCLKKSRTPYGHAPREVENYQLLEPAFARATASAHEIEEPDHGADDDERTEHKQSFLVEVVEK